MEYADSTLIQDYFPVFIQPYYQCLPSHLPMLFDTSGLISMPFRLSRPIIYLIVYQTNLMLELDHDIRLLDNSTVIKTFTGDNIEHPLLAGDPAAEVDEEVFIISLMTEANPNGLNGSYFENVSIEMKVKKIDDKRPCKIQIYGITMQNLQHAEGCSVIRFL